MSNNVKDSQVRAPGVFSALAAAAGAAAVKKKPAKETKAKKTKKPKKPWTKKRIITWAVIAVVVIFMGYSCVAAPVIAANAARSQVSMSLGTTVLTKREISTSISATGTVESADKHYVYPASAAYSVKQVPVEVGSEVQEGDILCLLDDSSIKNQIDSSELSLTQSAKAASQQVKTARDSYNAIVATIDNGTNSTLISAQSQMNSAYISYNSALDSYDQHQVSLNKANANLSTANTAKPALEADKLIKEGDLVTATAAYETELARARQDRDNAIAGGDPVLALALDPDKDSLVIAAKANMDQVAAELNSITSQLAAIGSAQSSYDTLSAQSSSLSRAVDSAYNGYQTALRNMDAAIASVETQIQSSKNQLSSTRISAETANKTKDLTLEQLAGTLDDTIVRAPVSGTITAVYATVGGPGSGLLFVIEDVNDLIVKTTVKSYDIATVKEGLPVTIRSDATGDDMYDGELIFIAPATQKTAMGQTNTASEVFDAEVAVKSAETGLHIGMSARLKYIIDKQEDVLAVPYDAIYTNEAGQSCVLAAVDNGAGKYVLTEIVVTAGIESDLDVAISGEGIVEGLRIINEPEGRVPGEVITLV